MSAGNMEDKDLKEALITYEKLQAIEDDFEEVELEILRQQDKLTKDLYVKRQEVVSKIPQFWPLVFEQSPPDVDEYIQPSDSELLLNSLVNLTVDRFELPNGDPRSISLKWEFKENEWFEDKVLEKKFFWRYHKDGWSGHVSEPVEIKWKEGKDLTNGMLSLAKKVYDEEKAGKTGETEASKKLLSLMEETGMGGVSFFCWFGFRGRKVTPEESEEARKIEEQKRQDRKAGKEVDDDNMDEDDDDEDEYELEIFPTADDLAVFIAEDLWPNAIKYFTNAQEADDLPSDLDFEEMDEDDLDDEVKKEEPTNKKRKA
ncbi:phosphatase 2a inhibitor [Fusarium albosuccineum]|uniref:Phosphatase 2a inhibitor n=1 Tax=Fusarium albosuccineum TaxID=1237068 RepID=A0A8H4P9B1_9HYPO|nr:phosphatase 2a inhibitor [Fusarium albosuccineum]